MTCAIYLYLLYGYISFLDVLSLELSNSNLSSKIQFITPPATEAFLENADFLLFSPLILYQI